MTTPAATPPARRDETVTFWEITKQQFRKNRPAMFAYYCLLGLIVLATVAPLVTMNVPFAMRTAAGLEWPLFEHLFDRLLFPGGVDIFFNLLLAVGPVWWLGSRIARQIETPPVRIGSLLRPAVPLLALLGLYAIWSGGERSIFFLPLLGGAVGLGVQALQAWRSRGMDVRRRPRVRVETRAALAVLFLGLFIVVLYPLEYTSQVRVYRAEIRALESSGEGWAVCPPIFFHPDNIGEESDVVTSRITKPPSLERGNLLGTDNNGRDVFSRILFGTRISLTIGVIAVSIYTVIGIVLGGLGGYFGGWVDMLVVGMLQVMLCIPWLFLLLTIISVFDTRSIFMTMVAIGLTGWPSITRLVRGEFFRQKTIDYVTAAVALGLPKRRIIYGHILKNAMGPVLVAAAFGVAAAIVVESTLSFLGLGDANAPSWGQILMAGREQREDWLILSPGMAIFFVVTVLNLVGDGLRDAIDPTLRK